MQTAEFLRLSGIALILCVSTISLAQDEQPADEAVAVGAMEQSDEAVGGEGSEATQDQAAQNPAYQLVNEDDDDWTEPQSQAEADAEELRRLFLLYRDALSTRSYLEADTLAKRIVELSIRTNGLDSDESAKALTNLAIVQHNNREFDAALSNFTAAVEIVERIDNRLSADLINPLRGVAATHAAMGRTDLARNAFQRAVHVSHVNSGPHNKGQVETLQSMAELYISMGEYEDAVDIQENIYSIQARKIDPASLDILPALETQAAWQHRLRMYHRERVSWRRVINIIEKHHGKEALQLIGPLTHLGSSYLYVTPAEFEFQPDSSVASGESYLRRANRIAESNPDATWQTVEKTHLSLGDYYVMSGRPNRAEKIYAETWDLLSEDAERLQNRKDHLESVTLLQDIYPPKYYNSNQKENGQPSPDNFESGTVSFSYSTSPTGRVNLIRHLETQPPEFVEFTDTVGRSMRRLVHRPLIKDGKMVASNGNIYVHEFFYRPADIPQPIENSDGAAEAVEETTN